MRAHLARGASLAAVLAAAAVLSAPAAVRAQTPSPAQAPPPTPTRPPAAVRIGKWAALGLAAGFTAMGAVTHDRADRNYESLLDYCRANGPCPVRADGRYGNAGAEEIYRRVRGDDRAARAWLAGGQVALVGSAVLFIMELQRKKEPENIPFAPYLDTGRFGTLVGLQLR
jgi:hypothetical protein